MLRVGIDVGGTHTDAVLMHDERVAAVAKTQTTRDVTTGILTALAMLIQENDASLASIRAVMIGTTHFTNAFVEGRDLTPTAAIRLGLPAGKSLPPMVDWPDQTKLALPSSIYLCRGGHEFDGRVISEIDREEILSVVDDIASQGYGSIAISAIFSPVNADFELQAAEIISKELPDIPISLSHEIGRLGLLERENATIINAALRGLAKEIVHAFTTAIGEMGIEAPIYLSQNDGTLTTLDCGERYPVSTFSSGPTNSIRGAAFLSGYENCAVVDIGGTTADIGYLEGGFPRPAPSIVHVGGVRTNFRMPDVISLGVGGGSIVNRANKIPVGPESVGFDLTRRGVSFGGDVITATDLAIAAGRVDLGDRELARRIDKSLVATGLAWIENELSVAIDKMRTSRTPPAVVLVGGGSVLVGDDIAGVETLIRPSQYAFANAIGAAIAQIGGESDGIYSLATLTRDEAIRRATDEACQRAVAAGASTSSVRVVELDETALAYLPGNATRVRARAVGDLKLTEVPSAVSR